MSDLSFPTVSEPFIFSHLIRPLHQQTKEKTISALNTWTGLAWTASTSFLGEHVKILQQRSEQSACLRRVVGCVYRGGCSLFKSARCIYVRCIQRGGAGGTRSAAVVHSASFWAPGCVVVSLRAERVWVDSGQRGQDV